MRILKVSIVVSVLSFSFSGCTPLKLVNAWVHSKKNFVQCTSDSRILCEPGSEDLAKSIAPILPDAIATVEKAQFAKFTTPILIYTYSSIDSFSKYSGASELASGFVVFGTLNLSPKLLAMPERTKAILVHELSHLDLNLQMGTLTIGRTPVWFVEGLAVWVSNGGGAESVTIDEARDAFEQGKYFEPIDSEWLLFRKSASSYGLKPHMFYRQASMFVGYMHDHDQNSFENMLKTIKAKVPFATAIESSYHESLPSIWQGFLTSGNLKNQQIHS